MSTLGGLSVGELGDILKLPQSTVSRHLKTLSDAGLTDTRREGTSMFYKLSEAATVQNASSKQLRALARTHLDNDPVAKTDTHRLAAVLRKAAKPPPNPSSASTPPSGISSVPSGSEIPSTLKASSPS